MKYFLLTSFIFLQFNIAIGCSCDVKSLDEKIEQSSLIFSGKLIWYTMTDDIPDSLLFVATDVWKGRFYAGDTIFIYNNLTDGGLVGVKEGEEYLVYARSNIIIPCAGTKPEWSTTETDKLDYKFKHAAHPPEVLINGVSFTAREANRIQTIFNLSDMDIPDSMPPTAPLIIMGEKRISLKSLSQMDFYEPVILQKSELYKEGKLKKVYYLQSLSNRNGHKKTAVEKRKRKRAQLPDS